MSPLPVTSSSLNKLPREIIYTIFDYLNKQDIVYAFLQLNQSFQLSVKYYVGEELNLANIQHENLSQFCITSLLPVIGLNLRYLSINSLFNPFTFSKSIENSCSNFDILNIHFHSNGHDIRYYAAYLIHQQLIELILIYKNEIVGEQIAHRLLDQNKNEEINPIQCTNSLVFHLSSINELNQLKQYSESSYLSDGLYMIECILTGQWLTESKDDLCVMSNKLHRDCIFSIKQIDLARCTREYELVSEVSQHRLTVLIPSDEEEERWVSSSILSSHRKESFHSCSKFTFEKIDDDQFYIRPVYSNAKRLQISGKRIIVSLCENDNTLNHCFKLHRIS